MPATVIKKDGTKVPFSEDKIKSSIVVSAMEAGLSQEKAEGLANEVSRSVVSALEGEEVASTQIRDKVLTELGISAPAVAQSWRQYEEAKGKV